MSNLKLLLLSLFIPSIFWAQSPDSIEQQQFEIALQQQRAGQFVLSTQRFSTLADAYSKEANWIEYFNCKNQIARNYWQAHQLDSSLMISNELVASEHFDPQSVQAAETYNNIGVVHDMSSNFKDAAIYFHKCLDIRKEKLGEDHFETGKIYINMGNLFTLQGQWYQGIEYYKHGIQNFNKNLGKNHPYLITCHKNLSEAYNRLGQYKKALQAITEAKRIADLTFPPDHPTSVQIIMSLAAINFSIPNKIDEAIEAAQLAQTILSPQRNQNPSAYIANSSNLGHMYLVKEQYDRAIKHLLDLLDFASVHYTYQHPKVEQIYNNLGHAYDLNEEDSISLETYHKAMLCLLPSLDIHQKASIDIDFDSISIVNLPVLIKIHEQKTKICDKLSINNPRYLDLYRSFIKDGQQLVRRSQKELSHQDDQIRALTAASSYLTSLFFFYNNIDPKHSNQDYWEEIILGADQCKSILLQTALATSDAFQFGNVPDSLQNQALAYKQNISQLELAIYNKKNTHQEEQKIELFKLQEAEKKFYQQLESNYPEYYNLKYNDAYPSIQELSATLLTDKSILINYLMDKDYVYIFVLGKSHYKVEAIRNDKALQTSLQDFRKVLSNLKFVNQNPDRAYEMYTQNGLFLYEKLLQPFIPEGTNELIIMPDQELGRIPFETMIMSKANRQKIDYQTLDYVFKKYRVRYAYSAKLLYDFKKKTKTNRHASQVLAFAAAYPPLDSTDKLRASLAELPGAIAEVEQMKQQFAGRYFLGESAHEAQFKSMDFSEFSVLHMAMHGILDKKNPMNSKLAMSKNPNSNAEDDWLGAYELTNMSIPINLVVLSACETGDGQHQKVEGIVSLGRSFMYAGVPSIVMTLWQVNDFSTAEIMKHFYHNLSQGMKKSEALRTAKKHYLSLVADKNPLLSHPFFWAAYINLGDDDPIHIAAVGSWKRPIFWTIGIVLLLLIVFFGFRFRKKEA